MSRRKKARRSPQNARLVAAAQVQQELLSREPEPEPPAQDDHVSLDQLQSLARHFNGEEARRG